MGILDGIVEWIAEQIMYGLDMINTSVLGALGCDMNTFLRYFPAAETMYSLLVALAIGLILLGWVWNLFKNYGLGLGVDAEDPVKLTAKAILFIVLAYYADEIVNIALTIGGTPYSIFKQASEGVRGGVIIGLGSRLQVFQNRDIRNITSYNEIDLELPGKQPCAYYCITSDQDSTFDFLSSLFLSFVFIRLVRYADEHCPGGELPVPVHVLGEELCACGVIPDLSRKISVIRSRNLSMSCVFQNLAGLQNRYPYNQWQEILGNCDVQLFLGCTDALTAEFISDRTGEASISVTSKAKQLGTWRVSNYTPEYRETSGVGRRKLMTMDEVLRMDIDKALILIRGKNVLEVDKYDYSKHPEAKKLRPSKAASHVPAWRANQPQEKQTPSAPPSQAADKKPAQKKKPASAEKVVAVTKESIMKKKEDT